MSQGHSAHKENMFLAFLHDVKENLLAIAMVIAAIMYFSHYAGEMAEHFHLPKWTPIIPIIITICLLFFFNILPVIRRKSELNLRPRGEPDKNYFTTSPRKDDAYNFFSTGYEPYLEWLHYPKSHVLYLTGSSGSGKSSLINAYLAPKLRENSKKQTTLYVLRSYHKPLEILFSTLTKEENTSVNVTEEQVLNEIEKAAHQLSQNDQLLIILDQFEEFFLLRNDPENANETGADEKQINKVRKFFHLFLKNPPKNVYFLLSYRDDFQQLIDQLELPARNEHINFEQVKLLTFTQAYKFISSCPGLEIPEKRLDSILKEAASIDTTIAFRPIVLNLLGIILEQMVGQKQLGTKEGNLIRQYILNCLGKELRQERAELIKAMLTDFNTARPRTLRELSKASKLTISQLDNQMLSMQHYGLVRCIDSDETLQSERKWQIAHDFVALQLEKVVHGIHKVFWKKARPWLAPVLISILLLFSASYYRGKDYSEKKKAIIEIEKAGFTWTESSKTISIVHAAPLTDGMFQKMIHYFTIIQPDSLEISYNWSLLQSITFDYLRYLELVERQYTSLKGLETVTSLKTISIAQNKRVKGLDDLNRMPNISTLRFIGCDSLNNLDAISKLPNLVELVLNRCIALNDINGLKELKSLRKLHLIDCRSLQNLEALNSIPSLQELHLTYSKNIKEEQINNLKKALPKTTLTIEQSFDF